MADLSIEYHWLCANNIQGRKEVTGSKGDPYTVEWGRGYQHCTCKGFQVRKTCRHIKEAQAETCRWNAFYEDGEPTEVPVDDDHPNGKACPKCGGEVTSMGWGV